LDLNNKTMNYIQTHAEGSDCTAPYDVTDYKATNAKDFVDELLRQKDNNSWGKIYVESKCVGLIVNDEVNFDRCVNSWVEYKGQTILNRIPEEWGFIKIKEVKAAGGWGCMDYRIIADETPAEDNPLFYEEPAINKVFGAVNVLSGLKARYEVEFQGMRFTNKL